MAAERFLLLKEEEGFGVSSDQRSGFRNQKNA
jgi:hypothetical protein